MASIIDGEEGCLFVKLRLSDPTLDVHVCFRIAGVFTEFVHLFYLLSTVYWELFSQEFVIFWLQITVTLHGVVIVMNNFARITIFGL